MKLLANLLILFKLSFFCWDWYTSVGGLVLGQNPFPKPWLSRVSGEGLRCSPTSLHSGWLELRCLPSAMRPMTPVSLSAPSPSPPTVAFLSKALPELNPAHGQLRNQPRIWEEPLNFWDFSVAPSSPIPCPTNSRHPNSFLSVLLLPRETAADFPALLPSAVVGKMPQAEGQRDCGLTSTSVCSFSQANCPLLSTIISLCQKWSVHVCCPVLELSGVGESVQQH